MSRCPACRAFDAAERAALEGSETLPEHSLQGCTCASEPAIAMTLLGPERLALRPPRGIRLEVTFRELVRWVEHPNRYGRSGKRRRIRLGVVARRDSIQRSRGERLGTRSGT